MLRYEIADGVAIMTLDRPDARNAIDPEMACALVDRLDQFIGDDTARVLIVTGAGDKAFCAGGDLAHTLPLLTGARDAETSHDQRVMADPSLLARAVFRDANLDKPIIAAVNGACLAGGTEMLLNTDIRFAVETATFGLPEPRLGLIPFAGAMTRLPREIGYCRAMELLLTGQPISARTALELGMINAIVEPTELMPRALATARTIAANGPVAVRAIKRAVTRAIGKPLSEGYAIEDEARAIVMASGDAREGPRAFIERRTPRFGQDG